MTDPSGLRVWPTLTARVLMQVGTERIFYESMALRDGSWRCGKCGRGKIEAFEGDICRVCHAKVAEVVTVPDVDRIRAIQWQESHATSRNSL